MNLNIAFDIGGCLSKYPREIGAILSSFGDACQNVFIITDMHPKNEVIKVVKDNDLHWYVSEKDIYCADYEKYGEMAKAVLMRDLKIDIMIDDHLGYLQWDSSFGPAPLRLLVCPDATKPYWHPDWKCDGGDFGRRVYTKC